MVEGSQAVWQRPSKQHSSNNFVNALEILQNLIRMIKLHTVKWLIGDGRSPPSRQDCSGGAGRAIPPE